MLASEFEALMAKASAEAPKTLPQARKRLDMTLQQDNAQAVPLDRAQAVARPGAGLGQKAGHRHLMPPLIVLADANVLVKDVVSFAFFDLARAGAIDLRWPPQIEVEYAKSTGRDFEPGPISARAQRTTWFGLKSAWQPSKST